MELVDGAIVDGILASTAINGDYNNFGQGVGRIALDMYSILFVLVAPTLAA